MFIPKMFHGKKKVTQRSWSADAGWIETELEVIRDGFNFLSENSIRVQYRGALVSANKDAVEIQDPSIHGTPWHGYHYNQARKMPVVEFMANKNLRRTYPEITEWIIGASTSNQRMKN